jgi:hypothetical protein
VANILGIDLEGAELKLVELQPSGAGFALQGAFTLPAGALDAAALGAQIKQHLRGAGFKAASVVIALGPDAVICREVRHPDIPAEELPAVVQYQVLKESALPADESVVDFHQFKESLPTGERRSLAYVVRKGRVQFCEKLCEAAGLKLTALVPRGLALAAGASQPRAQAAQQTVGLVCSGTFLVLRQGETIFQRTLAAPESDQDFVSELRRGVAGYSIQPNMTPLAAIYAASHQAPEGLLESAEALRTPIHLYDPYASVAGAERLSRQSDYAVACGAAQTVKVFRKLPVNFLAPKRVMQRPNRSRTYGTIAAIAAAVLVVVGGGLYWTMTSSSDSEIATLQARIKEKRKTEESLAEIEKQHAAITAWSGMDVVILDEIYDLIAAFPDVGGMQIVKYDWSPISTLTQLGPAANSKFAKTTAPAAAKAINRPVATLVLEAVSEDPDRQFPELKKVLDEGKHWRLAKSDLVPGDRNRIKITLEVLPIKPGEYTSLVAPGNFTTAKGGDSQPTNRRGRGRITPPTGGRP